MSDTEEQQIQISIKSSGEGLHSISISENATVTQLKEKVAESSGIPKEQQRLVYSGRILKDPETISSYKIKSGNAIHLVKSAPKKQAEVQATAANPGNSVPAPSALSTGQETGNPLSDLTGARYSGLANLPSASMFGPDGGQGPAPSMADLEELMAQNPDIMQQLLSEVVNAGPDDPIYRALPASAREEMRNTFQSPLFRSIISDPERFRQFLRMSSEIQGLQGLQFPTDQTPLSGLGLEGMQNQGQNGENPFGADLEGLTNALNFSRNLRNQGGTASGAATGTGTGAGLDENDSALLAALAQSRSEHLSDTRPPEEKYEHQLSQLNELGFFDFDRNVKALRRSGGNVEGAVEALLENDV